MKQRFTLFLIISFFAFSLYAHGGIELHSRQMKTRDGLPGNTVRTLYQDSKGFLWIGSLNGLSRYDGNSFITFQPDDGKDISLADNRIYNITEDQYGFLWVGTSSRLYSCYDLQRARFVDYTGVGELSESYSKLFLATNGDVWLWHPTNGCRRIVHLPGREMASTVFRKETGSLPDNHVTFVQEDAAGRIWIGTQRGLALVVDGEVHLVDESQNFYSSFSHGDYVYFLTAQADIYRFQEQENTVFRLAVPPVGKAIPTGSFCLHNQWIVLTTEGVYMYDFETQKYSADSRLNLKRGELICDNRGNYWIYNHTGCVYYILASTGKIKEFRFIPEDKMDYIDFERYHIVHDSRNIIWISTYGNGLFAYDVGEDKLHHFTADITEKSCIHSDFLMYVMEDRTGGIWVSTEFSGISRISVLNEGTTRVYPGGNGLLDRSNAIRMITQTSDGHIGVTTRKGGLYTYDTSLHRKLGEANFHSNIYAIAQDIEGQMWLGTRGEGLKVGENWYKHEDTDPGSLSSDHIFAIHRDLKGRMWIGTFGGGLDLALPAGNGKYTFRHFFRDMHGVNQVRTFQEDKEGMIWMGTSGGICIFHPDSLLAAPDRYHLFSHAHGNFCSNDIKCFFHDSKGRMWAGTSGMGLVLCQPGDGYARLDYTHYGTIEGLVNNSVQSILEDKSGKLWVATEYGMSRFTPDTYSFENYYFSSHPLSNVYSENCAYIREDGDLIFGTNYGLTIIDPQKVHGSTPLSQVAFTDLYINGIQAVPGGKDSPLQQSLAYSEEILLKYFQSSFLIHFSTFDYSDSGQTQYMYWLENYDKEWSTPSSMNVASYKYLEPGDYVLHVKSRNETGVWNTEEALLKITVLPPFWKTNWAFFCYVSLILFALYFTFRIIRNINNLRNRIHVEKQLTEYKLVFFTNISHEFRTPLTLIQGALEKMQRFAGMPQELVHPLRTMEKSTNRMLRLINQLLEFRKMQNDKLALSLEETDVIAFLYEIFLSFGDVADQKKMDFRFLPSVPVYKMFIDKGNLDKVTYNLLSNAFKYTPSRGCVLFSIVVDEEKKRLQIQVSDTGVGIPKEKKEELFKRFMQSSFSGNSIGVGLHLTHELVLVHKGSIEYTENTGGGSVFTVYLPIDQNVYDEKDFLIPGELLNESKKYASHLDEMSEESVADTSSIQVENKRKILIIEDDDDIRQFLKEEVGAYFEVEVASDGKEGFKKACSYDADLIICDVLMPGMTGFEVTKELKSDFSTSHIPIILLTALNSPEKHLEGVESGADAYIVKPFSIKLLLAQVCKLIEQRDKLREKYSSEPGIIRPEVYTTDRDKEFVDRVSAILEQNLSRPEFTVDEFASLMKLGRSMLYRKLRGLTGYPPNEYLRMLRMKKAAELLLSPDNLTVAEVAYQVGINDPFYFSKCFKAQFGIAPSFYQRGINKNTSAEDDLLSGEKSGDDGKE